MEILIISGLSGAGKSSAATYLEDMGYFTMDNVPADIVLKFAAFCSQSDGRYDRVALVSDIRSGDRDFSGLLDAMDRLKQGGDVCRLLFVTADLETIIKRYKETRRRHPLMSDGMTIEQAMHREQEPTGGTEAAGVRHQRQPRFCRPGGLCLCPAGRQPGLRQPGVHRCAAAHPFAGCPRHGGCVLTALFEARHGAARLAGRAH